MIVTVEKIVMATINSGLNSTYLLISEERRARKRRERQRLRIIRQRASEEDRRRQVPMLHLETCLLIAEADRVLYHLITFNRLFALDLQTQIQLVSRFVCYSWLACLLGFWLRSTA